MGYRVSVFEALPVAGGMLAVGIPEYRLPKNILKAEIEHIKGLGVEIKTNTKIENLAALKGYDAVFIATGAHESRKLNVPGEELKGAVHGVSFLRDLNLGKKVKVGNRVAIVGGGNVAIDSARAALRLGAKEVIILYRRSRAEMPANVWEIEEAEEEGVKINYLVAPTKIIGKDGKVAGIECIKMELGEVDETGRRKPIPIKGSEFVIDVDMVIPAIGQEIEINFLKANNFGITDKGTLYVDANTLATNLKSIFGGGDITRGPATVVEAIADGYKAAVSIDRYLRGENLELEKEEKHVVGIEEVDIKTVGKRARVKQPQLPAHERIKNFAEVNLSLTEQEAIEESKRCLNCAVCSECKECEKACEPKAIIHDQKEEFLELEVGTIVVATGFDVFDASLKPEYGYGKYQEVINALEFERLSSASGPTSGEILVNGKKPKKVIFIQCVGSRDKQVGNEYCSRVCCMYTAKQAHLIKEKIPDCEVVVCYTDVRAFGKGFEEFYDRVKNEGVIYRRSNVGEVYKKAGKLVVRGEDTLTGEVYEEETDLVVLATGLVPRKDSSNLATMLRIPQGADKFFLEAHPKLRPLDTFAKGIYLAGCAQSPKDIPDSVAQAKGAASSCLALLESGRVKLEPYCAVINKDRCSACRICEVLCNYSALKYDSQQKVMLVEDALCEGCGSCSSACPSSAIKMNHFTDKQIYAQIEMLSS
ncbi:MAG: FAD-dependent oxidoreductase, partial [Candidatus Thermoplasmatota archaeon]